MNPQQNSTLIPDKMPSGSRNAPSESGGLVDLLFLIAIIAFVAALSLAAGVFLYHQFLSANAESKKQQITQARAAFEPALISELLRLDSRLVAADTILARHLAPSELFRLLNELTLQSVSYESLQYDMLEDGTITLTMNGKAQSVNGVAQQADVFGRHNAVVNPIFSGLDFVSDGIAFTVNAEVDPASLRYVSLVNFVPTDTFIQDAEAGFGTFETAQDAAVQADGAFGGVQVAPQGGAESSETFVPGEGAEFGSFGPTP